MSKEWKLVSEELPDMHADSIDDEWGHIDFEESDPVLAYDPECGIVVCVVGKQGGQTYWVDEPGTTYHITHWMPLPESPVK